MLRARSAAKKLVARGRNEVITEVVAPFISHDPYRKIVVHIVKPRLEFIGLSSMAE